MKLKTIHNAVVVLAFCGLPGMASAQNCSLRNPDRQIFEAFPDATSYRSVVQPITPESLLKISERLGSKLRLREVGKHTLYVALQGKAPIGFVHARTELGERGALELVWSYDLDLSLIDFHVQRCRERNGDVIRSDAFRAKLVGADLSALLAFLVAGNTSVDVNALGLPESAKSIAHTTVLCAATTRLVTELGFHDAVLAARLLGNAHRSFPDTVQVTRINDASSDARSRAAHTGTDISGDVLDPTSLVMLRTLNADGETLGASVFARWTEHPNNPELWLAVSAGGRIVHAAVVGDVGDAIKEEIANLVGQPMPLAIAANDGRDTSGVAIAGAVLTRLKTSGFGD